jgi:hypothetical protein
MGEIPLYCAITTVFTPTRPPCMHPRNRLNSQAKHDSSRHPRHLSALVVAAQPLYMQGGRVAYVRTHAEPLHSAAAGPEVARWAYPSVVDWSAKSVW